MKLLVIGATGFLGGGAARALRNAGHAVAGSARSPRARAALEAAGYAAVEGDVAEPASLAAAARASEGVVFAVQLGGVGAAEVEKRALRTILEALAGSGKPFVYTSGVWYYGDTGGRRVAEDAPANPPPAGIERPNIERIVLDAAPGVRAVILRPGDVYGEGKGLPAMWTASARAEGRARYVGDGTNRWPMVHVDDLGELYRLALERAPAGSVFNGAGEREHTVLEMAQAASRGAERGGETVAWPVADAVAAMGAWAAALAMDQRVSSQRARTELGWSTRGPGIIAELESGSYARGAA